MGRQNSRSHFRNNNWHVYQPGLKPSQIAGQLVFECIAFCVHVLFCCYILCLFIYIALKLGLSVIALWLVRSGPGWFLSRKTSCQLGLTGNDVLVLHDVQICRIRNNRSEVLSISTDNFWAVPIGSLVSHWILGRAYIIQYLDNLPNQLGQVAYWLAHGLDSMWTSQFKD